MITSNPPGELLGRRTEMGKVIDINARLQAKKDAYWNEVPERSLLGDYVAELERRNEESIQQFIEELRRMKEEAAKRQ